MIRLMPWPATVIEVGLAAFCFVDVLLIPERHSRWLPRWGWALVLLAFPMVGVIGWISAGRQWRGHRDERGTPAPGRAGRTGPGPATPPGAGQSRRGRGGSGQGGSGQGGSGQGGSAPAWSVAAWPPAHAPSPEADLAVQLSVVNAEHERTLRRWEDDLLRREAELRRRELELQGGT